MKEEDMFKLSLWTYNWNKFNQVKLGLEMENHGMSTQDKRRWEEYRWKRDQVRDEVFIERRDVSEAWCDFDVLLRGGLAFVPLSILVSASQWMRECRVLWKRQWVDTEINWTPFSHESLELGRLASYSPVPIFSLSFKKQEDIEGRNDY